MKEDKKSTDGLRRGHLINKYSLRQCENWASVSTSAA